MANRLGTRWRGKLSIPQHAAPVVRQLFRIMNEENTTLTEVAEKSGVQRRTISEWRYRRGAGISNIDAALGAMGYELWPRKIRAKR